MGIFLLLWILSTLGEAHSITALVGEDVTLLYDPKQSTDLTEKPVKWTTIKTKSDFVHLHRKGPVHSELQNPAYRGRTILSAENLERGIIALTLIRVRLADEGNYTCSLPSLGKVYTIQLLVGAVAPPVITLEEFHGSSLLLRCESVGWYPRPQLSWGHSEGPPLPAVTMNTTEGPAGLYSISSTAVVERSQSCRCRVHQEQINQTRETEIHFPENLFSVQQPCPHFHWGLAAMGMLILVLLVGLVVLVVIARRRKKRIDQQRSTDVSLTTMQTSQA